METLKERFEEIFNRHVNIRSVGNEIAENMINALHEAYNMALPQWVRVEDSEGMILPPFEIKTQIICADGEQHIGYFNGADRNGYVWFCDNNDYRYPTHWMQLPTPPNPKD